MDGQRITCIVSNNKTSHEAGMGANAGAGRGERTVGVVDGTDGEVRAVVRDEHHELVVPHAQRHLALGQPRLRAHTTTVDT